MVFAIFSMEKGRERQHYISFLTPNDRIAVFLIHYAHPNKTQKEKKNKKKNKKKNLYFLSSFLNSFLRTPKNGRAVVGVIIMGGADSRVSNQHPLSSNHRAAVARPYARLQTLVPRRQGPFSLFSLRSRTQVRVCPHRVSGLVVAGVRDQD